MYNTRNYCWLPFGTKGLADALLSALVIGLLVFLLLFKVEMIAAKVLSVAVFLIAIFYFRAALFMRRTAEQARSINISRPCGTQLFAEGWLLCLLIEVPDVGPYMPFGIRRRKFERYASALVTALRYFREGWYMIGRDGSMEYLGEGDVSFPEYTRVVVPLSLDNLPDTDTMRHRLKKDIPQRMYEVERNCVLLGIDAVGLAHPGRWLYGQL